MSQLIEDQRTPLLSCLAVSGILVYLGMHVVERKVIFVDLALAQIAALGVMWAILMGYDHETDTLATTLYSLAFTAIGAAGVLDHPDPPRARAARGADRHHLRHRERRRAGARGSLRAGHGGAQGADRRTRRAGDACDRRQARGDLRSHRGGVPGAAPPAHADQPRSRGGRGGRDLDPRVGLPVLSAVWRADSRSACRCSACCRCSPTW